MGYHLNGRMMVMQHTDKPNIIGKVGTLQGDKGINIAGMQAICKLVRTPSRPTEHPMTQGHEALPFFKYEIFRTFP